MSGKSGKVLKWLPIRKINSQAKLAIRSIIGRCLNVKENCWWRELNAWTVEERPERSWREIEHSSNLSRRYTSGLGTITKHKFWLVKRTGQFTRDWTRRIHQDLNAVGSQKSEIVGNGSRKYYRQCTKEREWYVRCPAITKVILERVFSKTNEVFWKRSNPHAVLW